MLKALFQKQLLELGRVFYQNNKTGKRRSASSMLLYGLLMVGLFILMAGMFFGLATILCQPLVEAGLGWLYFALVGLLSVMLGVFGSVFNTYAGLFLAKDNELLLAMPIPPSRILLARLSGVYLTGLVFEALVMVPALVVYFMTAPQSVLSVIFSVLLVFVIGFLVLTLTCLLGWVVALVVSRLKRKSLFTVVLSLAFLGAYYWFYSRIYQYLQLLVQNSAQISVTVRRVLYLFYQMGLAAEGNPVSMLIFTAMVLAAFALCCFVLSKTFLHIATAKRGEKKVRYQEKAMTASGAGTALVKKELRHFLSSPTYMLNCGLGTLGLVACGVFVLVRSAWLKNLLDLLGVGDMAGLMACAVVCACISMNDTTAPSVSLEGKNLWILQSCPVSAWSVLRAKLMFHLLLTAIPGFLCGICLSIALGLSPVFGLLLLLCTLAFTVFSGALGLLLNLKMPNLSWTSEVVPVKQGAPVILALLGGWVVVMIFAGIYYLVRHVLAPVVFLCVGVLVLAGVTLWLLSWLKTKGSSIFAAL